MTLAPNKCRNALAGIAILLAGGLPAGAQCTERPGNIKSSEAGSYSLKAQNQIDGSILVSYELVAKPTMGTVSRQGQLFSRLENMKGFLRTGEKGFPEKLCKQVSVLVDPQIEYSLELVEQQSVDIPYSHPYLPSRGALLRKRDKQAEPYIVAPESQHGGPYPANIVERAEGFLIRNVAGYR
jgi:hypothetical protein